jgi:hypothetical protein
VVVVEVVAHPSHGLHPSPRLDLRGVRVMDRLVWETRQEA